MQLTPSAKSGFFAGIGMSALLWGIILKIDALAKLFRVQRWVSRDGILDWITGNKGLFIVLVESGNAAHGLNNPAAIPTAIGLAIFNLFVVLICLPFRALLKTTRKFV